MITMTSIGKVLLLIAGIKVGLVRSDNKSWIDAIETCASKGQAPSFPRENNTDVDTWVGEARYNMSWGGVVTIQIEESQIEKNCFAFLLPHLNDTILSLNTTNETDCLPTLYDVIKSYLFNGTNGQKCHIADFNNQSIKSLPKPTDCLVNRGNFSEYVPCENEFEDGCQNISYGSQLRITLSFSDIPESGGFCVKNESCKEPEKCSLFSLVKPYTHYLIALGCLVVILDISCICCCVRCQIRRQQSAEVEGDKAPIRRPCSEAIERIYINRDLSSQNATYDVMTTDMDQCSDTTLQILQKNMQDYDIGMSRSAKSNSGDYDLAWAEGSWSAAVISPHVDYAQVEAARKQKMDTVPEEEIYSKQKLGWKNGQDVTEQPLLDIQKKLEDSKLVEINHGVNAEGIKQIKTADNGTSFNAPYETVNIRDQNQRLQTEESQRSRDNVYSTVKVIGLKHQYRQDEIPEEKEKRVESTKLLDNGSCINQTTAGVSDSVCKTKQDKLVEPSVKKPPNKVASKNTEATGNGSRMTRPVIDKVDITQKSSPVEELYNNLMKRDDTMKTISPEDANKMVDEATAKLIANMNGVLLETKL